MDYKAKLKKIRKQLQQEREDRRRKWKNYSVSFYKRADKPSHSDQLLGTVELDDTGVNQHFTLTAKAFRHAPEKCVMADIVRIQAL